MNNSPHVMLLGSGADQFAKEEGLEIKFFTLLPLHKLDLLVILFAIRIYIYI